MLITRLIKQMPAIIVHNASGSAVDLFVSKYHGGSDEWYTVKAGTRDTWNRDGAGWELVAFKVSGGDRAGVYVPTNSLVTFKSLNDIVVS